MALLLEGHVGSLAIIIEFGLRGGSRNRLPYASLLVVHLATVICLRSLTDDKVVVNEREQLRRKEKIKLNLLPGFNH